MTSLLDLERNDIPGAIEFASSEMKNGELDPDTAHILLMLQDDPSELLKQLETLNEENDV